MSYIYRQCLCEKSSRLCWEIRGKISTVFHSRHEENHVLDFHLDRQIRNNQAAFLGVFFFVAPTFRIHGANLANGLNEMCRSGLKKTLNVLNFCDESTNSFLFMSNRSEGDVDVPLTRAEQDALDHVGPKIEGFV